MSRKDELIKVMCIKDIGTHKKGDKREMYKSTFETLKEYFDSYKTVEVTGTGLNEDASSNEEE